MIFVGKFRWPSRVLAWCSICRRLRRAALERKTRGFAVIPAGER